MKKKKKKSPVILKKKKKREGIEVKLPQAVLPHCFSSQFGRKKFCGSREKIFSLVFHSSHFPLIAKQWKTQVFPPIFSIPPKIYPTKHNVKGISKAYKFFLHTRDRCGTTTHRTFFF